MSRLCGVLFAFTAFYWHYPEPGWHVHSTISLRLFHLDSLACEFIHQMNSTPYGKIAHNLRDHMFFTCDYVSNM